MFNKVSKKLSDIDTQLTQEQLRRIESIKMDSMVEMNLSVDQQILDLDPNDPEDDRAGSQDLDDAEVLDYTNSNGNVNPEQHSEEGKKRVKRVYESFTEQRRQIKIVQKGANQKANELMVGEDSSQDSFYFVWNTSKKKQWIVDMDEEDFEEMPFNKIPSKLRAKK